MNHRGQHTADAPADSAATRKRRLARSFQHLVVTTGTGSGKTECFLIPIISRLVSESARWAAPATSAAAGWWSDDRTPWISQRSDERRPAAMRSMILYPMNALVEDQLVRLRTALDGVGPRVWFEANRSGNRFHFGRYTGQTPVPGENTGKRDAKLADLRKELRQAARDFSMICRTYGEDSAQRYFMAQTLRQAEGMLIAQDQFDQVRATLRDQYRSLLSQIGPQVQGQLDATARDMGREAGVESLSLKIGELKGLEVFDDRPGSISLLAATRYVVELEGSKKETPMAMSITTAIFKGRLVYFYAYAVVQGAADLDWLRTVTRDWLPLAAAAN